MMGLSNRLNPTHFLTEREERRTATTLRAFSNVFLLFHMLFPSYLPLNGGGVPRLQASHVLQGQVKAFIGLLIFLKARNFN